MKRWLLLCLLAGPLWADDFSRYQIIIDRSPFGPVSALGAAIPEPGFAQRYQFVALVMSNSGAGPVQAIVFDREANRSYFRAQGESLETGVTVERIEIEPPKMLLKAGLETATLTFQARTPPPATPGQPVRSPIMIPGQPNQPGQPNPQRRIPFRRGN